MNTPTPQRPTGGHSLDVPLRVLDLPALLAQVRQEPAYQTGDRNSLTVFKTDALRVVLLALHAGAELKTHTAPGPISVQVLDGQLTFCTAEQAAELAPGQLLTLHAGIPHSVRAVTEAAFLLTLAVSK
ncbi:cupin domain-containing protein [Hymenobacter segetis]|uniref:Cupin domain-containing protein n=1 Tax=Hymenobacter segetis TaxID=2025509 RepID=A0ABU9LYF7_9BACT